MEKIFINQLEVDQEITTYFMVKSLAVKKASNGKNYLDIVLGDRTGEIAGKKWDLADEAMEKETPIKEGDVIKVMGKVTEFKGMKQLRLARLRMTNKEDGIEINDYIKAAPEDPEAMYDFIYGIADSMSDQELRILCTSQLVDFKEKLLYYPAAAKNHHAEMAGLLWHMKRMLLAGEALCGVYTHLDKDLVWCGVIVHDLQKMVEIKSNPWGISGGYSFEGKMLGHLVLGVRELDRVMREQGMGEEKRVMVEHMVISHHYEPEFGSPVRPLFPEAEMLHYLDVMDAKMYDMEHALQSTKPGEFSERVWTLNNRNLYKRTDK